MVSPWRPVGLWDVEAPIFSRQSIHRWRWGCQPYAPAALYPPERFLVLIFVMGWVDPRTIVRLEGLGQLKKKSTSLELEPATFRLVAQYLNQLRYRVPLITCILHPKCCVQWHKGELDGRSMRGENEYQEYWYNVTLVTYDDDLNRNHVIVVNTTGLGPSDNHSQSRNSKPLMEYEYWLHFTEKPINEPYLELDQSNLHPCNLLRVLL
jgi:hypothetical protein